MLLRPRPLTWGIVSDIGFSRFVALGDSQTEGLWDGDDTCGVVGFADRLAATLDSLRPGLLYANLAVRGRQIADVIDEQLPQALAMEPDLVTVCIGMNDVTRPGRGFAAALVDLEEIYARLADSDATVVTTTFPDVARMLPVGRFIAGRILQINAVIRGAAHRHGFALVDLYTAPSMTEAQTWSFDRMHASSRGHVLFAEAAAEALGLPGSSNAWTVPVGDGRRAGPLARGYAQVQWTRSLFIPWLWRHARGRSSGDGLQPKYPVLQPVSPLVHQAHRGA